MYVLTLDLDPGSHECETQKSYNSFPTPFVSWEYDKFFAGLGIISDQTEISTKARPIKPCLTWYLFSTVMAINIQLKCNFFPP